MKKFLLGFLIFIVVLLASAVAVPYFFKDKIIAKAKEQIGNYINAKTDFESIDLSLLKNIRNFPNIALGIDNLVIIGNAPFEGDTLLNLGNARISLDLMSILKGNEYKVEQIELYNVALNTIVNKDGLENWNIVKPSKDTSADKPFKLALNKLLLSNVNLTYDDLKNDNHLKLENIQHTGKGDFTSDVFDYTSQTDIEKINLTQGIISYLKNATLAFDSKLNIDQKNKKYAFMDNKLSLNDLGLLFNGFIEIPDSTQTKMDISFKADKTTFKSLL